MSLCLNLIKLEYDPLATAKVFRRPYSDRDLLLEIQEQVNAPQVATRLGDTIWAYALPEELVNRYEFKEAVQLVRALPPRFVNRLLRNAIERRLERLGYDKVAHDKFERPDDIAFELGDDRELVARIRWLVRPFSLPEEHRNIFTLLMNPRLGYQIKISLAQLAQQGIDWRHFGLKVRVVMTEQETPKVAPWRVAHTLTVLEEREGEMVFCESRDGQHYEVNLAQCWPLASPENRYHYLRLRYEGAKGERFAEQMKAVEDDFFALSNIHALISDLKSQIAHLELGEGLEMGVGDFLKLRIVSRHAADRLQQDLLSGQVVMEPVEEEEVGDEEGEEEEAVQLSLFDLIPS